MSKIITWQCDRCGELKNQMDIPSEWSMMKIYIAPLVRETPDNQFTYCPQCMVDIGVFASKPPVPNP